MALVPAVAGGVALAAYLNAKFHIAKDLKMMYVVNRGERRVMAAAKADKMSLWPYFEEQVFRLPETERAIWSREGSYTWRETYDQCNQYSQFMLSLGVKKHEMIGMYMTNSPEFLFTWLGSWGIGAAPAMVNYNLAGEALIHCTKLADIKTLLVDWDRECVARIEEVRPQLEALGITIVILDEATKARINSSEPIRPGNEYRTGIPVTAPMALIYTSGSTGYPKAVPFSVGRTLPLTNLRKSFIGIKSGPGGDRFYCCMPLYHGTGGVMAVSCLCSGVSFCIGKKFSVKGFWEDIRDSESTAFTYVGEAARYLLAQPPSPKDKDHQVRVMCGNGLRPDVWRRFQERFGIPQVAEFFNSSEGVFGLLNVCKGPFFQASVGHHGLILRNWYRNMLATAEVDHDSGDLIRDRSTGLGKRTTLDIGGEVLVQVPDESSFAGYWKNKKATDGKFVSNLFKKGDLWYRTGDALRRTQDGHWYFMDRLGDTFRWKSENVATMEVAQILGHCPGVNEVANYGVPVPGHDGRAGCAAIWLNENQSPTPDFFASLLTFAKQKLPKYAIPVFVRVLTEISPMHNQKQNKIPLKKDGISLDAVYGPGRDAADNLREGKDILYWWPASLSMKAQIGSSGIDNYVVLTRSDWATIVEKSKEGQQVEHLSRL